MTRVVEADGRAYQLEIHNAHFAVMTEKERNELKEALTTEFFGAQNPQIGLGIRLTGITTE